MAAEFFCTGVMVTVLVLISVLVVLCRVEWVGSEKVDIRPVSGCPVGRAWHVTILNDPNLSHSTGLFW